MMNKIAKYVMGVFGIVIVIYFGWMVVTTTFPVEEWFQQNPSWQAIFYLLILIGIIGIISAIVKSKRS
ncbi:MAG: hypothetical protein JSW14_00125 [Candidatus Bathyarchaeum sp.]|nr:MAG: hypothetical protein JSW14_00125 [Candidatus Bathyarchaeum sp.]